MQLKLESSHMYNRVPIYAQLSVFDAQESQRTLAFSCQCVPGTHGSLFLL